MQTREIRVLPALFLLWLVWLVVGVIPITYGNIRGLQKASEQLNNFCDPEPLLRWTEEELAYYIRSGRARKQRGAVDVLAINHALALWALGRTEQALDVQQRVDPETANLRTRLFYYTNVAAFFIRLGQLSEAEAALEKAQDLLTRNKKPAPAVQETLLQNRIALAMKKGETQGAEEELLSLLDRATVEYTRVSRRSALAELYLMERRFSDAREHLEYVVAHGNKLYVRKEAEELLLTLPGEGKEGAPSSYQTKYDE